MSAFTKIQFSTNLKTYFWATICTLVLALGVYNSATHYRTRRAIPDNLSTLNLDSKITNYLADFSHDKFEVCTSMDCIPASFQSAASAYFISRKVRFFGRYAHLDFDRIFTFDPEKCNMTCIIDSSQPKALIVYTVETEGHYGISFKTGGLSTSHWFMVFRRDSSSILSHWIVQVNSESPTDLGQVLTERKLEILH